MLLFDITLPVLHKSLQQNPQVTIRALRLRPQTAKLTWLGVPSCTYITLPTFDRASFKLYHHTSHLLYLNLVDFTFYQARSCNFQNGSFGCGTAGHTKCLKNIIKSALWISHLGRLGVIFKSKLHRSKECFQYGTVSWLTYFCPSPLAVLVPISLPKCSGMIRSHFRKFPTRQSRVSFLLCLIRKVTLNIPDSKGNCVPPNLVANNNVPHSYLEILFNSETHPQRSQVKTIACDSSYRGISA